MSKQAGIVLESGRGWAIIMRPDGAYQKIKTNQPLYPGQYYYQRQLPALPYGVAAAVLLFILVGAIDFFNVVAYASISSGIELGVNRWDRVVQVKTESEDAAQVVSQVNINGRPAQEAVAAVVSEIIQNDPLPEGETGSLKVTVHSKQGQELEPSYQQKLLARINVSVEEALKVHEKVKVRDESADKEVSIHYQTLSPSRSKKISQEERGKVNESGKDRRDDDKDDKNEETRDYQDGRKDNQYSPSLKRDASTSRDKESYRSEDDRKGSESKGSDKDKSSIRRDKYSQPWLENKAKMNWPSFKNTAQPGREKKDR